MNTAARAYLLKCLKTQGMWNADYRWAEMRSAEFRRRFKRGGFAWWERVGHRVHLKPKRGQKR